MDDLCWPVQSWRYWRLKKKLREIEALPLRPLRVALKRRFPNASPSWRLSRPPALRGRASKPPRQGRGTERNGRSPPPPTEKTTNQGFGNRFMDEFGFSRLAAGGQGVQERFWTRKHRKARGDLSKAPCESFQGQVLSDLRLVDQHISEAPAAGSAALHGPARPDSSCAASRRWLTSKSVSRCRERSRTRVD